VKRHTLPAFLLAVVVIDTLWIAASPPPGRTTNPFFLYLVFFAAGGFLAGFALAPLTRRFASLVGAFAAFALLALVMSIAEEVIAYLTGSGLYQDGKHALAPGLVHASLPLFTWSLGVYAANRLFAFGRLELYVIAGLSGWMCETVIGGLVFKQPLLALAALPAIAFSYFVLIFLPLRSIGDGAAGGRHSGWRVPVGVVLPAILWSLGGIIGAVLVRAQ
jgi:hypothetical protein